MNSTANGGGVAEMLQSLVRYLIGAGIDARWLVVDGSAEFFEVTKRIHNMLHGGAPGDVQSLEPEDLWSYTGDVERAVVELAGCLQPGDVALLEDPQTANLAPGLRAMDVGVVWRCHVGIDAANQTARAAWDFLLPFVRAKQDDPKSPVRAYIYTHSGDKKYELLNYQGKPIADQHPELLMPKEKPGPK